MPTEQALEMAFFSQTPLEREHEYEPISRVLILNSMCDRLR